MARHNQIGSEGELVAKEYLEGLGWTILEMNHRQKWGEIDIVSRETAGKLVFVEVKTVSYETGIRAEENLHREKLQRLSRTIETYLSSHSEYKDWRFDVVIVVLNPSTKEAKIRHLEDVIIGS